MSWLFQHLAAIAVWEWIVVPVVGIVIALVRKYRPAWASPIFYGLGAAVFTLILFVGAQELAALEAITKQTAPLITTENVEQNIRTWSDNFGLSVRKINAPYDYFRLEITVSPDTPESPARRITVYRPRGNYEHTLMFEEGLDMSELKPKLDKLSDDQKVEVADETSQQLALTKLQFALNVAKLTIQVQKRVPITSALTEEEFLNYLGEIGGAMMVGSDTLALSVKRAQKPNAPGAASH
jgi:hypothetical protein